MRAPCCHLVTLAFALALPAQKPGARELYQQTDYRGALAALNPTASTSPADWHLAGRASYYLAEYERAQQWFEKAAAAEPRASTHAHWLGKTLGRRAETSNFLAAPKLAVECRKAFERATTLDPRNTEAWSDLLEYYLSAPGFLGGGYEKAAQAAAKLAALDEAEGEFARARLAEKKQDWNAAEQHWRGAIAKSPRNAGRWIDLARFLARRGRHADSDRAFDQAAEAEPPMAHRVWFARAETAIEQKRNLAQARELLDRYLAHPALTPEDPARGDARRLLKKLP